MEGYPPGFRFYPTEEELLSFYLHNKLESKREDLNLIMERIIPVCDIYDFSPNDLPRLSGVACQGDPEQWFFFTPQKESEVCRGRPNRLTSSGYWKATGSPGCIYSSSNRIIGVKRTMVFYSGRAPNGKKTDWKMNEYKATTQEEAFPLTTGIYPKLRQEFSLCRVYKNSQRLRAFDRRPVGVVEIGDMRTQIAPVENDEAITATSTIQNPSLIITHSHLSESSSSIEHGPTFEASKYGDYNMEMAMAIAMDGEALIDWDQFLFDCSPTS